MEVVVPQEVAAAIDRLSEQLQDGIFQIAKSIRVPPQQSNFTRLEAAEYLRINIRTFDELVKKGQIRRAKLGEGEKGKPIFRKIDLDRYVESQLEMDIEQAIIKSKF